MAFQFSTSSEEDNAIISEYGIGTEVSYQYLADCGLFVEGGLSWNTFILPEERPNLTTLMAFGGFGYSYPIIKGLNTFAHVDLGTDTLLYDKTGSETITVKTGVGLSLLSKAGNTEVTIGCDGTFGFAKKEDAKYVNYRILPYIGANYNF